MRGQLHSQAKLLPVLSIAGGPASPAVAVPSRTHLGCSEKQSSQCEPVPHRARSLFPSCRGAGKSLSPNMRFDIHPPSGNTRGPVYTESILRSLHSKPRKRRNVSLLIRSGEKGVGLAVEPDASDTAMLAELQDAYPGMAIAPAIDHDESGRERHTANLRLRPDVQIIRCHDDFLDATDNRHFGDPLAGLLAAVRTGTSGRINCDVMLQLQPARRSRIRRAEWIELRIADGFRSQRMANAYLMAATSSRLSTRLLGHLLRLMPKGNVKADPKAVRKSGDLLFEVRLAIAVSAPADAEAIVRRKFVEIAAAYGRFTNGNAKFVLSLIRRSSLRRRLERSFLMTPKEIATLWHPLTASGDAVSRVARAMFREIEPPTQLTSRKGSSGQTTLGRAVFRQQKNQFGISTDDLRRHMIAIGKTGCGKSTFLLNVVRQQIEAGRGTILFDPHGQLAEEVLNTVPKRRTNDVIVFDAADKFASVGFNPMIGPVGTDPTLVADGVLTSFKNVFGFDDGAAPRLLHIFRNCLLSLIGTPLASFTNIQRILVDSGFRKSAVAQVTNAAVREFWLTEFNRWNERDRTQYIASLQNKLGAFTTNERLNSILNSGEKGIQLRDVMDNSKVLICNLSKGTVGHDASTLLGSLLLSSLQIAAMSRADIPEPERTDCVVVIDEFHSYLAAGNSTMADALAESRKYRTSYLLSTQMLEQLDPATLAGVLGNCGSTLCMTVGPRDAEVLAELLGSGLTPEDLMRIPKYHGYLRMLIDGTPQTFSMKTSPPMRNPPNRADIIRRVSRQKFGR